MHSIQKKPSGLLYAARRLFILQRVISFARQVDASMFYGDIDIVRRSAYALSVVLFFVQEDGMGRARENSIKI